MTIEIKDMDTFNLIKNLMDITTHISVQALDGAKSILEQMETVPSTDDEGYFIEDPGKKIIMDKYEMWKAACARFEQWAHIYADKNVTAEQFFNELCCSVYSGDEFKTIPTC